MKYCFLKNGFERFSDVYLKKDCHKLSKRIYNQRDYSNIFISRKAYEDEKKIKFKNILGKNPRPGKNLLDKLDCSFIFENQKAITIFKKVCGDHYRILDHKLVMGVPQKWIPKWIKDFTAGWHGVNLAEFIKPQYRDITYFRGIDYHQDIVDWPERKSDFVTGYIYLEEVFANMSPLYVLGNSHRNGASIYPHKLENKKEKIRYTNDLNKSIICNEQMLVGKSGTLFIWHPFILHGTKPNLNDYPRISVRLLIEKNRSSNLRCYLDKVNNKIKGLNKLNVTRKTGKAMLKNNFINKR